MKPWIGVTPSLEQTALKLEKDNVSSIVRSGGIPFVIPFLDDEKLIKEFAKRIDGLFLTGGGDIEPELFGEEPHPALGSLHPERDFLEKLLVEEMIKLEKPILGVCRGCQIINVSMGGDMYQDLASQKQGPLLQHQQKAPRDHLAHYVKVIEGTLLEKIVGVGQLKVNSFHHQAVRSLANGLEKAAVSSDGVIEAFSCLDGTFILGVQWHPENLLEKDPHALKIFQAFIEAAESRKAP